jgi:hypothetical protein
MQFMNLVMRVLPNAGSGSVSRFGTSLRLGILARSPKLSETVLTADMRVTTERYACRLMAVAVYDTQKGVSHSPLDKIVIKI